MFRICSIKVRSIKVNKLRKLSILLPFKKKKNSSSRFGSTDTKIRLIQRLAWLLGENDTQIHEMFHIFRHGEQTYGHGRAMRGIGEGEMYGENNMEAYITICKIDNQWEFSLLLRNSNRGGMEREMGRRFKREGTCIYLWLIHVDIWLLLLSCFSHVQLCATPIDGSPPGSPVPGILQARILEWAAISFPNAWKWKVKVKSLSHVQLFMTPWTAAYQAPPSMGFSRQEYWSGVPLPSLDIWQETTKFCKWLSFN